MLTIGLLLCAWTYLTGIQKFEKLCDVLQKKNFLDSSFFNAKNIKSPRSPENFCFDFICFYMSAGSSPYKKLLSKEVEI